MCIKVKTFNSALLQNKYEYQYVNDIFINFLMNIATLIYYILIYYRILLLSIHHKSLKIEEYKFAFKIEENYQIE